MTEFWLVKPCDMNPFKFWVCSDSSPEENFNALIMLAIYLSVIIAIIMTSFKPLYVGTLCVGIISVIYVGLYPDKMNETFAEVNTPTTLEPTITLPPNQQRPPNEIPHRGLRQPNPENPFMNVPVRDYDVPQQYRNYPRYNTQAYPTPETEKVRKDVNDDFELKLFQDPNGLLWNRQNSQRQFVSQPVGTVPEKQNEFAQWLYGKKYVCKTGSIWDRYGLPYTEDSLVCTGHDASEPSNMGRMENDS